MSLKELGESLSNPISRSGVNHRFEKIMKLNPERCKNRYVMYETVEIVEFGTQEDFDNLNLDADYDD